MDLIYVSKFGMASFMMCILLDCKNRLPDFKYNEYLKCCVCINHVCGLNKKCNECALWPDDKFKAFIQHKHKLGIDRENKDRSRQ